MQFCRSRQGRLASVRTVGRGAYHPGVKFSGYIPNIPIMQAA